MARPTKKRGLRPIALRQVMGLPLLQFLIPSTQEFTEEGMNSR
jgi:hypothetical protein